MKKKFFSSVLLLAMVITTVGMFVSCKDYDDDITDLRNQITSNATDLQSLVDEKINNVTSEISSLQSQSSSLQSAYEAADKALETSIANATSTADNAYAEVQSAQAQVASIAAAQELVETSVDALQTALDEANATIASQGETISSLLTADATLTEGMQTAQARADEAYTLAENALSLAEGKADAADVAALSETVETLSTLAGTLADNISGMATTASEAYAQAQANATAIESLQAQLESLSGTNDEVESNTNLSELQQQVSDNSALIASLQSQIAGIDVTSAISEAKAYTDQEVSVVAANITSINTSISSLQTAYAAADKELQNQIDALNDSIEAIKSQIADFDVAKINQYLAYANNRLKSLVFAPTTYVNGIEAIMFTTLEYEAWDESKLEADAADTKKTYTIDDANHTEEYLVNPKNISLDNIESFSFISNTATDISTRSVSESAPIAVAGQSLSNGVLKLKLTKTGTSSFGTDGDKFTIVALKAKLAENILTDEEIAAGDEIAVYSDWARLYETSETPYIHNAIKGQGIDSSGKIVENNAASHFYTFSTLYNGGTTSSVLSGDDNDGAYIVKEVLYSESLDLTTLVTVCDGSKLYDNPSSYGLAFEFKIMPYLLKNEGSTTDATDQAKFAKLDTDGKTIYSTAEDGSTQNRATIGRQPAIQVVLRDTVNNKVVDVKYFKIKWVSEVVSPDEPEVLTYPTVAEFSDTYECGGSYDGKLGEAFMNSLYTYYNIDKATFHSTYTLNTTLFATAEAASTTEGKADTSLGTINDVTDGEGSGQTHNLTWSIDYAEVTQKEYDAGEKDIVAYGYYEDKYGDRIVFELTLTLEVNQLAIIGTDPNMWDDNDDRNINQILYDDSSNGHGTYSTTQYFGSLVNGYMDDDLVTPSTVDGIILTNDGYEAGTANFIFDSDKLSSLPTVSSTDKWTISSDGLTLYYNGVSAATIIKNGETNEGRIQLTESNPGQTGSVPTAGAKLLIGNSVPVKLVAPYCTLSGNQLLDSFNVNFLTPLTFETSDKTFTLTDITNGGSSSTSIVNTIIVTELVNNPYIVWSNYTDSKKQATSGLADWYGLTVTFDKDNAMCNVISSGYSDTCDTPLSSIKTKDDGSQKYQIDIDEDDWTVTYYNKGEAIGHAFNIEIPIIISSKWQDDYKAVLKITVNPSSTVSGN